MRVDDLTDEEIAELVERFPYEPQVLDEDQFTAWLIQAYQLDRFTTLADDRDW